MAEEAASKLGSFSLGESSQTPAQPYHYHPLNGHSTIRLLELKPATAALSGQIAGRLVDVDLKDEPAYEAISYTWGPLTYEKLQLTDGFVLITENLALALRKFCHLDPSRPRLIWVDQVCINQSDTTERSQQVSIMGDIFTKAGGVFTWLGPGDTDTTTAVLILKELAASAERCGIQEVKDGVVYFQPSAQSSGGEYNALEEVAASFDFALLRSFYATPWFSRMWISQEVGLTRKVEFYCGSDQISFDEFAMGTSVIHRISQIPAIPEKFPLYSMISRAIDMIGLREILIKQGKNKLFSPDPPQGSAKDKAPDNPEGSKEKEWNPAWKDEKILDYVTTLGTNNLCTDDRDRVYAFISLRSDQDVNIEPDYSKSVEEVYTDFAKKCLARQDVRIVNYAGLAFRPTASDSAQDPNSRTSELPSWAPDWRLPRAIQFGGSNKMIFSAGTSLNPFITTEEASTTIGISGVFIDAIDSAQPIHISGFDSSKPLDFTFEPSRRSILALRHFFNTHFPSSSTGYPTGESALAAFARTVTADLAPTGVAPLKSLLKDPNNHQEKVNLWQLFEKLGIKPDGRLNLDPAEVLPGPTREVQPYSRQITVYLAWMYMTSLAALLKGRQLFVTRKKYIGLAPAMAERGDIVAVFGGSQSPFVLRPDREKKTFRVVGEGYLHGFMEGELLTESFSRLMFKIY